MRKVRTQSPTGRVGGKAGCRTGCGEGFHHWENTAKGIYVFPSEQRFWEDTLYIVAALGRGTEEDFGTRLFTIYSCEILDVYV